jgi:hypothetical protein
MIARYMMTASHVIGMSIAMRFPFWNMVSRAFATVLKTPKQQNHAADDSEKSRRNFLYASTL